jgi:eukaryotic-like serine/threonine-protein kinase
MTVAPGTRLGPYEILAPIGAGGMGEVFRAKDTKLERQVAIKILPAALADDPERLIRFEREARVLASLNHPNIAQIYGLEERALVMELVAGSTLSCPQPLETTLNYAKQIIEALEAAHEKSIIHRDLKPANIMITPEGVVKILDFGLASVSRREGTSGNPASSPTLTIAATQAGMIMGTAAYMSPEQASGKVVDKRSDIWSFGVVLYEMLTGQRLFACETVSHTLADVLRAEIDFNKLPSSIPAPVLDLLKRCLDRDVKMRLQSIGEARIAIQRYLADPSGRAAFRTGADSPRRERFKRVPWVVASVSAGVALFSLALMYLRHSPSNQEVIKLSVLPPPNESISSDSAPAISLDGRRVAFVAQDSSGKTLLWVRSLDSTTPRPLAGTEGARQPFWSPDNRFVGFFSDGKVKKVDAAGGTAAQTIAAVRTNSILGGTWSPAGVIAFGATLLPITTVSAAGGEPVPATTVNRSLLERNHAFPQFLPDGRHFLFLAANADANKSALYVGSLDSKETKRLLSIQSQVRYASPGFLLFVRENTLLAQPFDAKRLELSGEPLPIVDGVDSDPIFGDGMFSASASGTLLFRTSNGRNSQLAWFDRSGKKLGDVDAPGDYVNPELSPDGRRVAFERRSSHGDRDIWLLDLPEGNPMRFTFTTSDESNPIWSPDGSQIMYASLRDGAYGLYRKPVSGAGGEERVLASATNIVPISWSSDGRFLSYRSVNAKGFNECWILPLHPTPGEDTKPVPYLQSEEFNQSLPMLSPNGHWTAYHSDETGRYEVYLQSFPTRGGKRQISTNGGTKPRWSKDGGEIFYLADDQRLMAVPFKGVSAPEIAPAKSLLEAHTVGGSRNTAGFRQQYDVASGGQRFLLNVLVEEPGSPLTVILHWPAALKK